MSPKTFIILLFGLSALVSAVLVGFQYLEALSDYTVLSWISFSFFFVFSLLVYRGGQISAGKQNKQIFGQFFLAATAVKMLMSLTIILLYFLLSKPATQYFIIPFFFVYLCYTCFEVYFMTRLGNTK
jgi:hypothetical protein